MIVDWQEETGDALYPVSAIEEYFYENPEAKLTHAYYGPLNFEQWRKLNDKHILHHFEQFNLL